MNVIRHAAFITVSLLLASGCANPLHYGWAYVPLHDPNSAVFQLPQGEIEYRELKDVNEMVAAERDMYRKGYIMVGYSNMMSPQLEMIAPGAARNWAEKVGASAVLHRFGNSRYLATFWAKPKSYVFGAYFSEDMPAEARTALKETLNSAGGVVVVSVVEESPAFQDGIRPGDLLIYMNDTRIESAAALDKLLQAEAGHEVEFLIWSMEEGAPRRVSVALNRHASK